LNNYVVLLRGINVGGKNKLPMAELRQFLEALGYSNVSTFIASGNVLLASDRSPAQIKSEIEGKLPGAFKLDSELIAVLVLTADELRTVVNKRPAGFGDQPAKYHSDAIFLVGIDASEAMRTFTPKDGVDTVWPGDGVIYSQRLSARRTQSRLNRVMASPAYKSMTIRNWNTTTKLLELLERMEPDSV
jgi:uncharacterized protein (DUF1697 family)